MNIARDAAAAITHNKVMVRTYLSLGIGLRINDAATEPYISSADGRYFGLRQIGVSGDRVLLYMFHGTHVPTSWSDT